MYMSAGDATKGNGGKSSGGGSGGAAAAAEEQDRDKKDDEADDCCSICLEGLEDDSVYSELGEALRTACGHRFHAVCFAQHLEASENDPWW
jgi:hypothetical protein